MKMQFIFELKTWYFIEFWTSRGLWTMKLCNWLYSARHFWYQNFTPRCQTEGKWRTDSFPLIFIVADTCASGSAALYNWSLLFRELVLLGSFFFVFFKLPSRMVRTQRLSVWGICFMASKLILCPMSKWCVNRANDVWFPFMLCLCSWTPTDILLLFVLCIVVRSQLHLSLRSRKALRINSRTSDRMKTTYFPSQIINPSTQVYQLTNFHQNCAKRIFSATPVRTLGTLLEKWYPENLIAGFWPHRYILWIEMKC